MQTCGNPRSPTTWVLRVAVGLTTVLIGRAAVEDVVQPLGTTSLDLLPAGQIPLNPSELLGSMTMAVLLERLSAVIRHGAVG